MTFSELNLVGMAIAFVVSFISGGIWFGPKTFYPIWMKARGIESGQLTRQQNKPAILFGGTILGVLIQTLTVALIVTSLQAGNPEFSVANGALVGAALGVGIAAFASLSHRLFGGENFKVWIIETANDALNLTIAGAIIAYFN
jgi:hypothetical protein